MGIGDTFKRLICSVGGDLSVSVLLLAGEGVCLGGIYRPETNRCRLGTDVIRDISFKLNAHMVRM